MAVLDAPENASTAVAGCAESSSNLNFSVRRRRSDGDAASGMESHKAIDSGSVSESETSKRNGEEPRGDKDKIKNRGEADIKFTYRPSVPAHRTLRESPLSSDAIFRQSHAGLFNLCIVVLIAVNSRLIIENIMKYGWLIRTGFWFSSTSLRDWPLLMCCTTLPILSLAAFLVEKLAYTNYISDPIVILIHIIITSAAVLYPVFVILSCDSAVLSGVTLMLFACIVWLKLVSYAHTNYDLRAIARSIDKGDAPGDTPSSEYSRDVSFKSLVYFMLAPTLSYQVVGNKRSSTTLHFLFLTFDILGYIGLCPYSLIRFVLQPSYPRTSSIRKGWVFRQFVKLIIFTGFMGFIIEQYINPIVKNSQHPLKGDFLNAIERVLKLSVPNLYVWLCMFYCFFHLWLNILAELLRFGDREFYKDWWNARTVDEYWRMWNMPVHKWMVRHIYFPCLRHGIPKGVALVIAFFVSAVFHELCIAVPCHIFKLWAFIGIMFQIPLVVITNFLQQKFKSSMVGNMIFWFIFCILGQPMCVLLYYHDVMNRKGLVESG